MPDMPSEHAAQTVPVFKVWGDDAQHPPVQIDRPVCIVGRHETTNLVLNSDKVSKVHALIVHEQERVYVRDLASTNGVERNGAPVREAVLADTDILRIGAFTLRCESGFGHPDADSPDAAPSSSAPPAELRGPVEPFIISPGQRTVLIGRREGCDLRVDDRAVAPVHALIFERDGRRYVQDLGARSGTLLNNKSIRREEINNGDEIQFGQAVFRYAVETSAAEADAVVELEEDLVELTPVDEATTASPDAPAAEALLEVVDDSPVESEMELAVDSAVDSPMESAMETDVAPEVEADAQARAELQVRDEPESSPEPVAEEALEPLADRSPEPAAATIDDDESELALEPLAEESREADVEPQPQADTLAAQPQPDQSFEHDAPDDESRAAEAPLEPVALAEETVPHDVQDLPALKLSEVDTPAAAAPSAAEGDSEVLEIDWNVEVPSLDQLPPALPALEEDETVPVLSYELEPESDEQSAGDASQARRQSS